METTLEIEFPCTLLKKENKTNDIKKKLNDIQRAVCGLLNTKGGRLILYSKDGSYSEGNVDDITRRVEQKVASLIGDITAKDKFAREAVKHSEISFLVEVLSSLCQPCTINYKLYYMSATQVKDVPSSEPMENVQYMIEGNIRKRKLKDHAIIGDHERHFVHSKTVDLRECESTQFKNLKDEKSKKCDLVSRMKNNKLACYVSAFANGDGGHIYYGIKTDKDGNNVVEGEVVQDQDKIVQEVDKTIRSMCWPKQFAAPEKGKQWDVFFEPVSGVSGSDPKFIIVISVAPFPRGVFAKEPESYHVVNGKVRSLGYLEWKKRLCQHRISDRTPKVDIQLTVGRSSWSSVSAKKMHEHIVDQLVKLRNNGSKQDFQEYTTELLKNPDCTINTKIIIQQQRAVYLFREGNYEKAEKLLQENKGLVSKSLDAAIYNVRRLYWMCVVKRSQGELQESDELYVSTIQNGLLTQTILIEPWLFVHKAKVLEIRIGEMRDSDDCNSLVEDCKELLHQALRRALVLEDSRIGVVALKQRVHVFLAKILYGYFLNQGKLTRRKVLKESDRKEADKMLDIVVKSSNSGGWPMTSLCECEFLLVESAQHIRNYEQYQEPRYLEMASRKSADALKTSEEKNFKRVINYAKAQLDYLRDLKHP